MQIANQGAGQMGLEAAAGAMLLGVNFPGMCGLATEEREAEGIAERAEALLAQSAVHGEPRLKLVEGLRRRIAAGTYRVRSADLAEKMMGTMLR
jgi:Anti-sigma-28 factor, FlgM